MKTSLFPRGELRRLFVDCLVVLIGVLAALVLHSIREEAVASKAAALATERLLQEVEQNAQELRDAQPVVTRRMALLRELRSEIPANKSLREIVEEFNGYWFVDFNTASWEYLSRSELASAVDPALLQDAFELYTFNKYFEQLNVQTQEFIFSEQFVSPEKTSTALVTTELIMWQQLTWLEHVLPKYEKFLSRYSATTRELENVADTSR